jgi:3-hydroxymyristoyl/3-hydroxydecanoyl-(acyl carrier protein) dehydratase
VILTEALAQTAGIAASAARAENARLLFLLSAIKRMKFFHAVHAEERIVLRAEKIGEMGELFQFKVGAGVDGKRVAEGELVLSKATPPQAARDSLNR